MRKLLVLAAMVAAIAASSAAAQDDDAPKPPPAHAVTLPVVVRDAKGAPVGGLAPGSFSVNVEGAAQSVTAAAADPAAPVVYGLVFDVSKAQRPALENSRRSARTVISRLRSGDKVFVVQFARQIELLEAPTADKARLERALNLLGTSSASFQPDDPNEGGVDSEGRRIRAAGPVLYDALFLCADEVLRKQPGRHVLLVFSDGVDVGSKEGIAEAKEAILRSGTLVYGLYTRSVEQTSSRRDTSRNGGSGPRSGGGGWPGGGYPGGYPGGGYPGGGYPGGYPGQYPGGGQSPGTGGGSNPNREPSRRPRVDGREALLKLSNDTGGRLLENAKRSSVEEGLAGMSEEVRSAYWVSFTPAGPAARHGFHRVDLTVNGPDHSRKVEVQTPDGYYTGS